MSKLAVGTIGTEAFQVIRARHLLRVLVSTIRTVFAEASGIPRTLLNVLLWIDVPVHTLRIGTLAILGEEVARWHPRHVELVKKLACSSLFTQATQPMLADHRLLTSGMLERTRSAFHAGPLQEELADVAVFRCSIAGLLLLSQNRSEILLEVKHDRVQRVEQQLAQIEIDLFQDRWRNLHRGRCHPFSSFLLFVLFVLFSFLCCWF